MSIGNRDSAKSDALSSSIIIYLTFGVLNKQQVSHNPKACESDFLLEPSRPWGRGGSSLYGVDDQCIRFRIRAVVVFATCSSLYTLLVMGFTQVFVSWPEQSSRVERAMLTVDRREKELSRALGTLPHEIRELPVGDVLCEYGGADAWVAERKSASDLAASIVSGRLLEQTARLHEANYQYIFWLVEGDLRGHLS